MISRTQAGVAIAALVACTQISSAQLIRPNSATATSEFSSNYVITNTINGSGLPANFGLEDAHADYSTGNHWTTRSGQTIGQSATFTFTTPQTLGGFYIWNHRSNAIAANRFYEVTRFDLVLFDGANGAGSTLATFADLTALPNLATAQTIPFTVTGNVRSVRFIVRATENNNASPFTGLAEVAFGACIAPSVRAQPIDANVCSSGTASFAVDAPASGPASYLWQIESMSGWVDLNDGPVVIDGEPACATASGTREPSLVLAIGCTSGADAERLSGRNVRCVISNSCGSVTSDPAKLRICAADFNCDALIDFFDYLDFSQAFGNESPSSDVNQDGVVDFFDYLDFVSAFDAGC
ncbi:MAG: hypothetical protein SFZ23_07830 [Planctomycetota bacterium]|nr:hypothetical protein [Planctomycetota bacterium]